MLDIIKNDNPRAKRMKLSVEHGDKDNDVFIVFPIDEKHALHIIIKNGNNNVDTIVNAGEWTEVYFTKRFVFIMAGIDTPYMFNADTVVYIQQALEEDTDDIK